MNEVILAWFQGKEATAAIYVNGVLKVTFLETGARAPSPDYVYQQAMRHLNRVDEGNVVKEIDVSTLPFVKKLEAPKPPKAKMSKTVAIEGADAA